MKFEVMPPKIGQLGVANVRDAVNRCARHVDLMVLASDGGAPFIGRVELGTKRSGPALHPALICGACGKPRRILYVARGRLACAACSRHRSRRQKERTLASWTRGGREEDQLLRLLLRPGRNHEALSRANELVDELLTGDMDRLAALRRVTDGLDAIVGEN